MKIPGYRRLVDVVLPEINKSLSSVLSLCLVPIPKDDIIVKIESGYFYFDNGNILSLYEMIKDRYSYLDMLLYLYFSFMKYNNKVLKKINDSTDVIYSVGICWSCYNDKWYPDGLFVHRLRNRRGDIIKYHTNLLTFFSMPFEVAGQKSPKLLTQESLSRKFP